MSENMEAKYDGSIEKTISSKLASCLGAISRTLADAIVYNEYDGNLITVLEGIDVAIRTLQHCRKKIVTATNRPTIDNPTDL